MLQDMGGHRLPFLVADVGRIAHDDVPAVLVRRCVQGILAHQLHGGAPSVGVLSCHGQSPLRDVPAAYQCRGETLFQRDGDASAARSDV